MPNENEWLENLGASTGTTATAEPAAKEQSANDWLESLGTSRGLGPSAADLAKSEQAGVNVGRSPQEHAAYLKGKGYSDEAVRRSVQNLAFGLAQRQEREATPESIFQNVSPENLGKFGKRMGQYIARREIPFSDVIPSSVPVLGRLGQQSRDIEAAKKAFADGTANPYQVRLLAQTQREAQDDAVMGQNVAGKIIQVAGSVPKIIGEMEAGGALLRGAGGALGIGRGTVGLTQAELAAGGKLTSELGTVKNAAGQVINRWGTFSPQAARAALAEPGTVRALATAAGQRALLTPLVPSMWVDEMRQRNLAQGRDVNDWQGAPPALAHGYLQMLVLGSMQAKFGIEGSFLKRTAIKGGIFAGEASTADSMFNLAHRTLAGADQFNTKYGTFENLMSGNFGEAGKEAMVQVFTGALFAGMHEAQHSAEPGKAIDPKTVDRRLEAVRTDMDAMHKAGVPPKIALQRMADLSARVQKAAVDAESDPAAAAKELADATIPGTSVKSKLAEDGAKMVGQTKPFDPWGHIADVDLIDLGRMVTGTTKKNYTRDEAVSDLTRKGINPSAFPGAKPSMPELAQTPKPAAPAEPPSVAPEGRSAGPGETPPGPEIALPAKPGEAAGPETAAKASEKPTERYFRTPDSKGAEDNVDAAVKELVGDTFAGKWFSRTFEGNAGYKGHVQLEFHGGRLGGPKDVVEKGEKDVRIGGESPMYMHPALTAIRYRGPENTPQFQKLQDVVKTANQERAAKGIEPIELLTGKAAKEPRKLAEPAPEFGKPLTPEEEVKGMIGGGQPEITARPLNEGQVGGVAREIKETALANEMTERQRADMGLPEIALSDSVSDQKLYNQALERMAQDRDLPVRLVQELLDKPRPVDAVESFVLLHRRVALSNEYDRAIRDANLAYMRRLPKEEVDAAFARAENLLAEINRTDHAIDKTGTETGRSLRIRRRLMFMNYSLSTMLGRAAGAKGEEPLTEQEHSQIIELQNRIAELTSKLDEAETAGKPLKKEEAATTRIELAEAKRKFEGMVTEFRYANLPVHKKILTNIGEAFNFSRMLKTAYDFSAIFRQGAVFAISHPVISLRAARDMLRQFASKSYYEQSEDALRQRPNAPLYERERLLADMHGPMSAREELFISRWLHGIAEVKPGESLARKFALLLPRGLVASERAFTGYLNRVRADVFDASLAALQRNGKPTDAEIHAIGNWVGVATGRGPLGAKLENAASLMAQLFFAPRYAVSRFQLLAGQPLYGGTARTRKLIARDYARFGIGLGLFYLLSQLDDEATVTFDPRSSDFGKIRFGNTRLDPLTGMSQAVVWMTRLASGEKTTTKGEVLPLREQYRWSAKGKVPYGGQDEKDVFVDFFRNKAAPIPGAAMDTLFGKTTRGELSTASGTAENMAVPMVIGDVYEALQDQGLPRGAALSLLAILGMGSQTYEPRQKGKQAEQKGPIKKAIEAAGAK